MDDIQFQKNYSSFIRPNYTVSPVQTNGKKVNGADGDSSNFSEILQQKQQVIFSKHAQQRMEVRQIQMSPQLLSKMNGAVEQARAKGIKDALILNGQTAFIVNIPSSTVVTTISGSEMNNNVFTNIDGAVIL